MDKINFFDFGFLDFIDVVLVALFLYYVYKLLRGTAAINILIGIFIMYLIYKVTLMLELKMFSSILGALLGVGVLGLMIVFQQEIRKFLLMMGTANFRNKNFLKQLSFLRPNLYSETDTDQLVDSCFKLSSEKTGALIVLERTNNLDFVLPTGDKMNAEVSLALLESIFYKNSPLHDGAIIIKDNYIKAARIVLPLSNNHKIPKRFGLRHKAALGISEKTDAICLVVSEETGEVSFVMDGELSIFTDSSELKTKLENNLK